MKPVRTPRVAIVTLTMDRLEYTQRMMASLAATAGMPYAHFIVDNGSSDGTVEHLRNRVDELGGLIVNRQNVGITEAMKQALALLDDGFDYVVKADNDCEFVTPGWLRTLVDIAEASENPVVLSPAVEGLLAQGSSNTAPYEVVTISGHPVGLVRHVGGLCVLAPYEAHTTNPHERTALHGGDDVRFSVHVRVDLGWQIGYVLDTRVLHMDTTAGQHSRYPEYFSRRPMQRRRVWGEPATVSAIMRPFRDLRYLARCYSAGLTDRSPKDAVVAKLAGLFKMPSR